MKSLVVEELVEFGF